MLHIKRKIIKVGIVQSHFLPHLNHALISMFLDINKQKKTITKTSITSKAQLSLKHLY